MNKITGIETRIFVYEQANKRLRHLAFEIGHIIKSNNADDVHDLRVAVRRFKQTLLVFKQYFRGKELRKIRQKLKRVMILAGEVRNCDVALKILSKSKNNGRIVALTKLQSRRRQSEKKLMIILKRWHTQKSSRKWGSALETAVTESTQTSRKTSIASMAQQFLPPIAEDLFELGYRVVRTKDSPTKLHQLRIALKKFRYSLEVFAPLYGTSMNPLFKRIKRAQTILGDINDYETVEVMISHFKNADGDKLWLRKRQRRSITEFKEYWCESFGTELVVRSWIDLLRHAVGNSEEVRQSSSQRQNSSGTFRRAAC